ncbi:MAG: NFACT family protein, partial [Clostridia bacterium]|nr:NFACT family protein [Clostridia bacterium]
QIQPGLTYLPPPAQDKLQPEDITAETLHAKLLAQGDVPLHKALAASVSGLSNPAAKELAFRVANCDLPEAAARLADLLRRLPDMAAPRVLVDDMGDALDVFAFPYLSQPLDMQKEFDSLSAALERYFGARDAQDRINQKSASMVRLLKGQIERCEKKLALQEEELASAARMEEFRLMGEILNANLWQLRKGMQQAELPNFYDENGGSIVIPLDIQLTPTQNAQRYFKKYQKARSARETAAQQKEKTLEELNYLETMLLDVGKCVGESELEEIRQELVRTGYMKRNTNRRQQRALPKSKPYKYESSDGILMEVGKNAAQNDRLTTGARPNEWWLHAKDMPGSHVIVHHEGDLPDQTLKEAAILAAWYSKGQRSSSVPIDYTLRRHVKKPSGAAPGMMIYTNQKTLFMTVTEADVRKIRLIEE